jgi:hypothetical protein
MFVLIINNNNNNNSVLKIKRETIYRNNNLFYSIFFVRLWSLTSIMSMGRLSLQLLADAIHIISYIFDYQVVPNGEDRGSRSTNLCLLVFSSVFFSPRSTAPTMSIRTLFPHWCCVCPSLNSNLSSRHLALLYKHGSWKCQSGQ